MMSWSELVAPYMGMSSSIFVGLVDDGLFRVGSAIYSHVMFSTLLLGMCDAVMRAPYWERMCDVSDLSSILGMCLEFADVISIQYAHIWACHICAHILVSFMPIYGDM